MRCKQQNLATNQAFQSFAEAFFDLGLLAIKTTGYQEFHFVLCWGKDDLQDLYLSIPGRLINSKNWNAMVEGDDSPLDPRDTAFSCGKQAVGIDKALQLELIYLKLTQLLTIALGTSAPQPIWPSFHTMPRKEFSGHSLYVILKPNK